MVAAVPGHYWHCDFQLAWAKISASSVSAENFSWYCRQKGYGASGYIALIAKQKLTRKHFAVNSQFHLGHCVHASVSGSCVSLFCDKCCV